MPVDLRRGGPRLLMRVLAVDHRGESVLGVVLDTLPDVEYRATRRVDQDAADLLELFEVVQRHAECGQDDDVPRVDGGEVERSVGVRIDEGDSHIGHPLIHVRIMDDLTDEVDVPVREFVHRLVCVVHRPIDAIAEAELLGEADGHIPVRIDVAA